MKRSILVSLAVAGASASLFKRQLWDVPEEGSEEAFNRQIEQVCRPSNTTSFTATPDLNAPCNALMVIQYQCLYGPGMLDYIIRPEAVGEDREEPTLLSNETQRDCICQSQHTDMLKGCMACFKEHGSTDSEMDVTEDKIQSIMDDYCKADNVPTQSFDMVFYDSFEDDEEDESSTISSASAASTTFSDPLNNATDVSLYFTPSVTGSAAYMPAIPTPESSGVNASYTSVSTSGGQIVPTAAGASGSGSESEQSSGSEESGSASATESDSGAMQTAMAQAGVFGAVGIAALMAAL